MGLVGSVLDVVLIFPEIVTPSTPSPCDRPLERACGVPGVDVDLGFILYTKRGLEERDGPSSSSSPSETDLNGVTRGMVAVSVVVAVDNGFPFFRCLFRRGSIPLAVYQGCLNDKGGKGRHTYL